MAFRIVNTRLDWVSEERKPASGDLLVIPANEHLWMLSGPGLELKKIHGKEVELDAVRLGPVEPGQIVVVPGGATGYRLLVHAAVMTQHFEWVPGAGRTAILATLARAERERADALAVYPLYRGAHGRREEPAREMLSGFIEGLQGGVRLKAVSVLYAQPEEKAMLHEIFLRLLSRPPD